MGTMPKLVRPADQPERLESFIHVFGNRARMSIIRFLLDNGPALRVDIAEATRLSTPTLAGHLTELERVGVVHVDLPPEQRRGRSLRYEADGEALRTLLQVPSAYIFEDED